MDPDPRRALRTFVAPFAIFILFQGATSGLASLGFHAPEQWMYPVQTAVCAAVLWAWRRDYPWTGNATALLTGIGVGALVFLLWISPQAFFHAAPRTGEGFNPEPLRPTGWYPWAVGARFVRLAVVVPLLEEIFWRGFVMRYLIREDFTSVALGAFTPFSFLAVAVAFALEHAPADWPAAFATGMIYNLLMVKTRSLPACVLAHAVTNLLLGIYIMQTHQWGFW